MCCVTIGVPLQAHFGLQGEKSKEFIKKVAQKVAESVRVIGEQIQPPAFRPPESAHPGEGQPDPAAGSPKPGEGQPDPATGSPGPRHRSE